MSGKSSKLSDRVIRRLTKWVLEAVAVAVGGIAILAVVLAVRLSQGPMPLDFLSPYIVQALKGLTPDADITVGETVLIWSDADKHLQVRARDVRVHGPNGVEWASVPELSVALSLPALASGLLAPAGLEIYGLHVRLVRTADGKIQFGDTAQPPSPEAPVLPEGVSAGNAVPSGEPWLSGEAAQRFVDLLAGVSDSGSRGAYLERVSMIDAAFVLDDQKTGHIWNAPEAHLSVVRGPNGTVGRATLVVELGGTRPNLDVVVHYRPGDSALAVDLDLADLDPAALAKAVAEPVMAPLEAVAAPLGGKAHASIGLDGAIQNVSIEMDAGAGQLDYSRLGFGAGQPRLPFEGIHLRAHLTDALDRVAVDGLEIDVDGARVTVSGEATLGASVPQGHIEVRSDSLPVATLIRYWPEGAVGHTREWMAENLKAGTAEDARLAFDIGPVGPNRKLDILAADGTFRFKDLAVTYFPPLPDVHGLSGTATLKTDSLTFTADSGEIDNLAISEGTVTITGLSVHDQDLAVEAAAQGPLRSALSILDNPRFGYVKALGINVANVQGDIALRLRVALPLENHITDDQLKILANANLREVVVPKAALGLDVTDGALSLAVDRGGLEMKGNANVAGAPARLVWDENFGGTPGFRRRLYFKGTLDDAARETAGLALEPDITGPIGIETVVTDVDQHRTAIDALADLGAATLSYPDFDLEKKAGDPATAAVRATLQDGHLASIDQLEVRGHDLVGSGRIQFGPDGKTVRTASLSRVAFGETDVAVEAAKDREGVLAVRLRGPKLNVEPLLSVKGDDEKPVTPMTVDVAVDFARLGKDGGINGLTGHLARDDKRWYSMIVDGTLAPSKPMAVRMSRNGTTRPFSVTAEDGGLLLKALSISDNVVGGTLSLSGQYDDSVSHSPFKGDARMRNYHVVKAPLMAKVLSVASLTGIVNALSGQGIDFSTFDATITFVNGAVFTDNLRAHGSALGFTGKGTINLKDQTVDLEGTVVPAYTVNSVLGNIPILGSILAGPEGGGVFAATYRMRGSLDDPTVSVNPLATLTPGFLRNLFNIFETAPKTAPPVPAVPEGVPVPPTPSPQAPENSAPAGESKPPG
jgi:hypothetical protein